MIVKNTKLSSTKRQNLKLEPRRTPLDMAALAEKLGAEYIGDIPETGSPFDFYHVRLALYNRIKSNGGRPSLTGADTRRPVPLTAKAWEDLEMIAREVSAEATKITATHVASYLLTEAIRQYHAKKQEQKQSA